ncbi:MAG: Ig-like domain-containing protein, partial [Thermoplasmata archaeon]
YTYQGTTEDFKISSGSSEWTNHDKTLTFNPDMDFQEDKEYTVSIGDTAKDEDGIAFEGFEWSFTIKVNSPPVLAGGGVYPEKGDTSDRFKFSIVYTDDDDDEPTSIKVVIDDMPMRMLESDRKDETFTDGKTYEFEMELDEGEHKYYFEVSNEKHDVRFPKGQSTRTLKVSAVEEELIFGIFEKEYVSMPTMICGPIGIILLLAIIIGLILIRRRGRAGEEMMSFETFEEGGAQPMTFMPTGEEEIMSFTTFEGPPSLEETEPVVIQCPECQRHLRVRAVVRPFMFPCKCGAKLILK